MSETLAELPVAFWAAILILVFGTILSFQHLRDGSGVPMLAVLGTVTFWYVGDSLYNGYAGYHTILFEREVLSSAWWQVAWFLTVFLFASCWLHRAANASSFARGSGVLRMLKHGVRQGRFQGQVKQLFRGSAFIWLSITALAVIRIRGDIVYYLFPFLGYKVEAFGRTRIGGGIDAIFSMLFYLNEMASACFGVVAALSCERRIRWMALFFCFLSWPCFLFDRTRNNMLVVIMPGILALGFLGIRGGLIKKFAVLAFCFLAINAWMGFVIANRSESDISQALHERGFNLRDNQKVHHEGLNMYEELCWINTFIRQGTYEVNWGRRYFAEFVNFVPRVIWHGKPEIGIDYAIARGGGGGSDSQAGVNTTVSTGLIGQGVVNFGRVLGPAFAALLMSVWTAILARLDLDSASAGNIPLYGLGLILTFNMGRDISLIVLYPFVFGSLLVWWYRRKRAPLTVDRRQAATPSAPITAPRLQRSLPVIRRIPLRNQKAKTVLR